MDLPYFLNYWNPIIRPNSLLLDIILGLLLLLPKQTGYNLRSLGRSF